MMIRYVRCKGGKNAVIWWQLIRSVAKTVWLGLVDKDATEDEDVDGGKVCCLGWGNIYAKGPDLSGRWKGSELVLRFPWFDPILRISTAVLAYMYKACAMADPAMTLAIRLARRNAVLLTEIAQPDSAASRQGLKAGARRYSN